MPRRGLTTKYLILGTRPVTIPVIPPVTVAGADVVLDTVTVTEDNPVSFTISGNVEDKLSGVTITLTGQGTKTTNVNGDWFYPNLKADTYVVTPTKTGYTFTPVSLSKTITTANITDATFYSITGENIRRSVAHILPVPDGKIGKLDRKHVAGIYRGIY